MTGSRRWTIETFRPLFEDHWPRSLGPVVFEHDHGRWQDNYRAEVPALLDPEHGKYVTVTESEDGARLDHTRALWPQAFMGDFQPIHS